MELYKVEQERKSTVFLSMFDYGMNNYKDCKMQAGNGNYAYIGQYTRGK